MIKSFGFTQVAPVYGSFQHSEPTINIFNKMIMQIGDNSEMDAKIVETNRGYTSAEEVLG